MKSKVNNLFKLIIEAGALLFKFKGKCICKKIYLVEH